MHLFIFFFLLLNVSLFGASFDCAKAKTNVEKIICSDSELSALDENLSKTFKEAMKNTEDKEQLKKKQFAWMRERNQCKAVKCIKEKYQEKLVSFENSQYIKQLKIDDNTSLYYVDYHVLISDLQNGKYQINKECKQCQKDKICKVFIDDIKNNRNIEWITPTVQTVDFNDPSLQKYLSPFSTWIQSEIKERVYLTASNRYFDTNRENSDWNDYPYQTKFIKLYEIKDAQDSYYFILADGFYNPKLGLFGEKRENDIPYTATNSNINNMVDAAGHEALGIYAFLDKNSQKIDQFSYAESMVKLSKKMSHIREVIKHGQQIYLLEAYFDKEKNRYAWIDLTLIEKLNPKRLSITCKFSKIEEN
jgi:uncharacterized protein